jgi:hypothetical protein
MRRIAMLALLLLFLLPSAAHAHYLWILVKPQAGEQVVDVVFEEATRPGDGRYLDPILERGTTWIRSADRPQARKLEMHETRDGERRWLRASPDAAHPLAVESYVKWGVYRYGQTDALLHYYARYLDSNREGPAATLRRAEKLDLDIVPAGGKPEENEVQVLWKGKPVAGRPIDFRGPRGRREKLTTDAQGRIRISLTEPGIYTLRTSVIENQSGSFQDKDYTQVRHNVTLVVRVRK